MSALYLGVATCYNHIQSTLDLEAEHSGSWASIILILVIFILPLVFVYLRFFARKDMVDYEEEYGNCSWNKWFRNWLLIPFSIFMMIVPPYIAILLFGGHAFGHDYYGLLIPLLDKILMMGQ